MIGGPKSERQCHLAATKSHLCRHGAKPLNTEAMLLAISSIYAA
jgi:hypothetical protein